MKIAFVCSGFTRTYELVHDSILEFLELNSEHQIDFFFLVLNDDHESGKFAGLENSNQASIKLLENLDPKLLILSDESEQSGQYSNLVKLYTKIIDSYPSFNDDYDLAIRSRFDIFLHPYEIKDYSFYSENIIVPFNHFYGYKKDFTEFFSQGNLWKSNVSEIREKFDLLKKDFFIINDRFAIGPVERMQALFMFGEKEMAIHEHTMREGGITSTKGALALHLEKEGFDFEFDGDLHVSLLRNDLMHYHTYNRNNTPTTYGDFIAIEGALMYGKQIFQGSLSPNVYEIKAKDIAYLESKYISPEENMNGFDELSNLYLFPVNKYPQWGGNFFHFHFHELQRLMPYLELQNIVETKLAIPKNAYGFQLDAIFALVDRQNIVEVDFKKTIFKSCFASEYTSIPEIPQKLFDRFTNIGESICPKQELNKPLEGMLYIGRKSGYAGENRRMTNSDEFLGIMNKYSGIEFFFESHNLEGKVKSIVEISPKCIVIEIGSAITNLMFLPKWYLSQIDIIVLETSIWRLKPSRINSIFDRIGIQPIIVRCENHDVNEQDPNNSPFIVDCQKLDEELGRLEF